MLCAKIPQAARLLFLNMDGTLVRFTGKRAGPLLVNPCAKELLDYWCNDQKGQLAITTTMAEAQAATDRENADLRALLDEFPDVDYLAVGRTEGLIRDSEQAYLFKRVGKATQQYPNLATHLETKGIPPAAAALLGPPDLNCAPIRAATRAGIPYVVHQQLRRETDGRLSWPELLLAIEEPAREAYRRLTSGAGR